jgi:predicted Zn-dependent protease
VFGRAILIAVALAAIGWLGVLYRDVRVGQAAADTIVGAARISDADLDHQMSRLDDATLLNPSRSWDTLSATFLLLHDRPRQALRAANGVARAEPDNAEAWLVVARAAEHVDPPRARQAVAELRRLNPLYLRGSR